jgi:hypothetical protein
MHGGEEDNEPCKGVKQSDAYLSELFERKLEANDLKDQKEYDDKPEREQNVDRRVA